MADGEELPDEVKTFIVQELAMFGTPKGVADRVKEEFQLVVSRQRVEGYHPERRAGRALSEQYRVIFTETRKAYLENTAGFAVAHRAGRMALINAVANRAADRGNDAMVLAACEQAASEMGDRYTNKQKHEHSGPNGVPLTATVILTGAPDGASAPQAVGGVPKPGD